MNVKQLKLTSGEEILCNVEDEDEKSVVINYAFVIQEMTFTFEEGFETRGYRLAPWMTYQMDFANPIYLNRNTILAAMLPETHVRSYYDATVCQMQIAIEASLQGFDDIFSELISDKEVGDSSGETVPTKSSTVVKGNFTKH